MVGWCINDLDVCNLKLETAPGCKTHQCTFNTFCSPRFASVLGSRVCMNFVKVLVVILSWRSLLAQAWGSPRGLAAIVLDQPYRRSCFHCSSSGPMPRIPSQMKTWSTMRSSHIAGTCQSSRCQSPQHLSPPDRTQLESELCLVSPSKCAQDHLSLPQRRKPSVGK